jgi:hypothetical protein
MIKLFSLLETQLNEMAKITPELANAIKKVVDNNPSLSNLELKKSIKQDSKVLNLLDGDKLHDNQLNLFLNKISSNPQKLHTHTLNKVPGVKSEEVKVNSNVKVNSMSKKDIILEYEGKKLNFSQVLLEYKSTHDNPFWSTDKMDTVGTLLQKSPFRGNGKKNQFLYNFQQLFQKYPQLDTPENQSLVLNKFLLKYKDSDPEMFNDMVDKVLNKDGNEDGYIRFNLNYQEDRDGLYLWVIDDNIKYVGIVRSGGFFKRIKGYGSINASSCTKDGNSTNCRTNSKIRKLYDNNADSIALYFWPQDSKETDLKKLETNLIDALETHENKGKGGWNQIREMIKELTKNYRLKQ